MDFSVSLDDQTKLLKYARDVIRASLYHQGRPEAPALSTILHCGAFVTLSEGGSLRGCIGRMQSNDPLVATVSEMAHAAAFEDPRFPPLKKEELDLVDIEITLLSPLHPIAPDEVVVGKHGLLISARGRSGVLLPQVPVEFHRHLRQKHARSSPRGDEQAVFADDDLVRSNRMEGGQKGDLNVHEIQFLFFQRREAGVLKGRRMRHFRHSGH